MSDPKPSPHTSTPSLNLFTTKKRSWGHQILYKDPQTHALFYSESPLPLAEILTADYNSDLSFPPKPVPKNLILPTYEPAKMHSVPASLLGPSTFTKPIDWFKHLSEAHFCTNSHPSNPLEKATPLLTSSSVPVIRREILTNEYLRQHPHPNVATYHGVITSPDGSLVEGLVSKRYTCDFHTYVQRCNPFDAEDALSQIAAGIKHLHSLNLTHCDVKPRNVFVDDKSTPGKPIFVLGDMDSVHTTGEEAEWKWGTTGWVDERYEKAEQEMDWYGLGRIRTWLEGKGWGRPDQRARYDPGFYEDTDVILGVGEESSELSEPPTDIETLELPKIGGAEGESSSLSEPPPWLEAELRSNTVPGAKMEQEDTSTRSTSSLSSLASSILKKLVQAEQISHVEVAPPLKDDSNSSLSPPPTTLSIPTFQVKPVHGVKRKYGDW